MEDKLLVRKFNRGDCRALSRIYEKYRNDLLRLAVSVLNDFAEAEDIVQDVFMSFAQSAGDFKLTGSLRGFLATCVINRARNYNVSINRKKSRAAEKSQFNLVNAESTEKLVINREQAQRIINLIGQLCDEQREVVSLRVYGKLKFKEIATIQQTSIQTVQSRYRLGLEKLKFLIGSEE